MTRSFLQSRASLLRRRPIIVGTLTGRRDVSGQLRRAASPLIDVIEVRLDTFAAVYGPGPIAAALEIFQRVKKACRKPILLTLRSHTERGDGAPPSERMADGRRAEIVAPLLSSVALVDVELRRPRYARRVARLARRRGVTVIGSWHDFRSGGRRADVLRGSRLARRIGADVFKVAVTPESPSRLSDLFSWAEDIEGIPVALIGMGASAAVSRVIGFSFGSVLAYGRLGASAAPGQPPAAELARAVRAVYGCAR